jgi:cell division protein FtsB
MKDFLLHPFALGFYTGCVLLAIALYHHFRLKFEHSRYRRMLSDKMEIDATAATKQKGELEALRKENENLRVKVQTLSAQPEQKVARDLEIFARAEKKMTIAAPGFAGPWEQAKQAAHQELTDEESGKAAPRRLFQRFFGTAIQSASTEPAKPLPPSSEPARPAAPTAG